MTRRRFQKGILKKDNILQHARKGGNRSECTSIDRQTVGREHQAIPYGRIAWTRADLDEIAEPMDAAVGETGVNAALMHASGGLLMVRPIARGAGHAHFLQSGLAAHRRLNVRTSHNVVPVGRCHVVRAVIITNVAVHPKAVGTSAGHGPNAA